MPTETRPIRPGDGWPISVVTPGTPIIGMKLANSPGANQSWFVTGFIMSGGSNGDGFSFLRRNMLSFLAADNTLTVTDSVELEPTEGDFAIEFGIKTSDHTLVAFISKKAGSPMDGFNLEILSTGQLKVTFGAGSTPVSITSYNPINDDVLHQVIVNWEYQETDGLNLYIDGEQAAAAVSNAAIGSVTGGSGDLVVLGNANKTFSISTLGLYKGQFLSSAEIAARWAGGAGSKFTGDETGISAAWNIDEGTGTDHQDKAVGNNDGTSANTVWDDAGIGFPIDPHTLKESIKYYVGILDSIGGIVPPSVVNLPHALKIGRNNPIFIKELSGAIELELYGFKGSYV